MGSPKTSNALLSKSTILMFIALLTGIIAYNTLTVKSRQPPYEPMPAEDRIEHNEDIVQVRIAITSVIMTQLVLNNNAPY